jgi:hypothetical protein
MSLHTNSRHEYYTELTNSLPPPVSDGLEHRERRLGTAIDAFNALRPGDAYEGRLAVQIVLCGAHAAQTLREASGYWDDYPKRTRCRAQANSLMREERAAQRMLVQAQKVRLAIQAVAGPLVDCPLVDGALVVRNMPPRPDVAYAPLPSAGPPPQVQAVAAAAAHVRAAEAMPQAQAAEVAPKVQFAETAAHARAAEAVPTVQAAEAMPQVQAVEAAVQVQAAETASKVQAAVAAAPQPAPAPSPVTPLRPDVAPAAPSPVQAASVPLPSPEAIAQAEAFAQEEVVAAAQIRHDHGVTERTRAYFHEVTLPTDPAVIDALVRGASEQLILLDEVGGEQIDEAA